MTDRERKKKLAAQRTAAARDALALLDRVLVMGLGRQASTRKKYLKQPTAVLVPRPEKAPPSRFPHLPVIPSPPERTAPKYSHITPSDEVEDQFDEDYNK